MLLVLVLANRIPRTAPESKGICYSEMLTSMVGLLISVRGIKRRLGAMSLVFTTFTLFWATVPIVLQDALHFSHSEIAIYSLLGLAAPPCAIMAGKMIDRGLGYPLTLFSIGMVLCAFLVTPFLGVFTATFVLAGLLLDPGIQITNVIIQQSVISLAPQARSRINALCIACTFIGGAIGSWLGPWLYSHYGWGVTVSVASVIVVAGFILNLTLKVPVKESVLVSEEH